MAPVLFFGLLSLVCHQASADPRVEAESAVLTDAETGVVLYEKASRTPRPVASTTKIATALLVLEGGDLDEPVAAKTGVAGVDGARLGLRSGDVMTLGDLVAATLVASANDCAFVIAEHLAGSVDAFADRMNARAAELGAVNTHFANPHGLHQPDHYSSAYDMALLTREALRHERFRELVGSRFVTVAFPADPGGKRTLKNHNKLLGRTDFVDGVKTGFVKESGHCLVASGMRDGWRLVAVVLDTPDMYADALRLLDYGFDRFRRAIHTERGDAVGRIEVRGGDRASVSAVCRRALHRVVGPGISDDYRLEVDLEIMEAPVEKGSVAGVARLVKGGAVVDETFLLAGEDVGRSRLIVGGLWSLYATVILLLAAVVVRTYAKTVKAHRSSRGRLSPEGGGPRSRRPGAG
jgi:D-alanyl-D-alanine carboxypeptidase (penicillin-binding protein 5/6)